MFINKTLLCWFGKRNRLNGRVSVPMQPIVSSRCGLKRCAIFDHRCCQCANNRRSSRSGLIRNLLQLWFIGEKLEPTGLSLVWIKLEQQIFGCIDCGLPFPRDKHITLTRGPMINEIVLKHIKLSFPMFVLLRLIKVTVRK